MSEPHAQMAAQQPNLRRLGILITAVTFLADQASKLWLLLVAQIVEKGPFPISSFFELTVVWNRGISYGMFQQNSDLGRWLLIGLSLAAAIWLGWMMWKSETRMSATSLGLIIGGALGNAVDRAAYGAVFDFAHFYLGEWSWYVFNVADAAIVVGVAGLLYDAFIGDKRQLT
ncbi:MAG: signal peptidase II [Bosea sp. (in: a-proteobacteria)]